MMQSFRIPSASMATVFFHKTGSDLSIPQHMFHGPPKLQTPLVYNQGSTKTSQFSFNFNGFAKPKFCHFRSNRRSLYCRVAESQAYVARPEGEEEDVEEDLLLNGQALQSTRRLVECAMFSAITGLAYFLSNLLRFENYFGAFLPLPLVISSVRWGVAAGRKTMVSTALLLLILSGPLKATSYLLMHGFVGFTMGALWRLGQNWSLSIIICTLVRCVGQMGLIFLSSWLIRENILYLIMINAHAAVSYVFAAVGINFVPSMGFIYAVFTSLLLIEGGIFVFLIHLFYAKFLSYLDIKTSVSLPRWLDRRANVYK